MGKSRDTPVHESSMVGWYCCCQPAHLIPSHRKILTHWTYWQNSRWLFVGQNMCFSKYSECTKMENACFLSEEQLDLAARLSLWVLMLNKSLLSVIFSLLPSIAPFSLCCSEHMIQLSTSRKVLLLFSTFGIWIMFAFGCFFPQHIQKHREAWSCLTTARAQITCEGFKST